MEINPELRDQLFDVIDNQIKGNDPPETKQTYERLRGEGFDDFQAKQLIAQCLAVELFEMMKVQRLFDRDKFVGNLNRLPEEPFEQE